MKRRNGQAGFSLKVLAVPVLALVLGAGGAWIAASALQPRAAPPAAPRQGIARVGDFALLDQNGRQHQLYRYAHSRAVVLFVYGTGCNISRDSLPALQRLREQFGAGDDGVLAQLRAQYAERGEDFATRAWLWLARLSYRVLSAWHERFNDAAVSFLMLDYSPQDDRQDLRQNAARYGIDMPILKDETQLVAESLGLDRTGEALLIDTRTWQVVYRGPVDDRLYYEIVKPEARRHYLRDAIAALLGGRPVPEARPAIGCHVTLEQKSEEISYARQVAPILMEKCVSCHQAGGIGPWAMDGYAQVRGWSAMMREVLMNRRMPPWHADPAIGSFSNDRSLSREQIRTLVHWIDAGAPRGDGPDPLAARADHAVPEWPLGEPDLVIDIPEQQIPAYGAIDYRYIDVPVPLDRDVWVRAVHLRPSNRAVMHHASAFIKFRPDVEETFFAAYVPGLQIEPFPEGSGRLLSKGTVLTVQLHYTAVGHAATDKPKLALYLHQRPPPRELVVTSAWTRDFRIPPYAADHPVEAVFKFDRDALLHAFLPHMHYRGSRVSYEARYPDGRREQLLSIPRFDTNWQTLYGLRTPKPVPAGTEIRVAGAFDNSSSNPANPDPAKEIRYGPQSWDEMFIGYVLYSVPRVGAHAVRTVTVPRRGGSG